MAGNWRGLPDGLPVGERELVEALRSMKDDSGLTLTELAARTHYSKSSWQRWLNGERLVTEPALLRLTELAAVPDPVRDGLLELWASAQQGQRPEQPEQASAGTDAEPEPEAVTEPEAEAEPEPQSEAGTEAAPRALPRWLPGTRSGRWAAAAAVLLTVVAAVVSTGLLDRSQAAAPSAVASPSPSATPAGAANGSCEAAGCVGKDPQAAGCSADAVTISSANVKQMTIYVRYSRHCKAAWAKITDASVGFTATVANAAGQHQTALVHWGYDAYSPMVDASRPDSRLQVCGEQPEGRNCGPVIVDPATAPVLTNPTPVPAQSTGAVPSAGDPSTAAVPGAPGTQGATDTPDAPQ
jgi:transcriptional regulator with XRE-family HTH domain